MKFRTDRAHKACLTFKSYALADKVCSVVVDGVQCAVYVMG